MVFISPHAQYTLLKYSAMAGDLGVIYRFGDLTRVSCHREHLDNLGEPGKAVENWPRLGLGCRLVFRKHFSFFRSFTKQ